MAKPGKTYIYQRVSFFYGWVILAVASLAVFFSGPGQTYSVSTFIDPMILEFGWSRSLISALYSGGTLAAGLVIVLVGRFVDLFGHRKMLTGIAFAFALACFYLSFIVTPLMLLPGFFLIRLLGQGSMTLLPATLIPQWFLSKRGMAFGIMAVGASLSSAIIPYLNVKIITLWDWRTAWQIWGLLLLLIMVPLAWILVRNKPEDCNLPTDNTMAPGNPASPGVEDGNETSLTLKEAKSLPVFWLLLFATLVPSLVTTGLTFHHISILATKGLTATTASLVFTVMALIQLPFNIIAGWVTDRYQTRYVYSATLLALTAATLFTLWAISPLMAILLGIIRGISQSFVHVLSNIVWPNYFGRKHLGSIRGVAMTAMILGSSLGPLPFGMAYDRFDGYSEIIILIALLPLICAITTFFATTPQQKTINN